MNKVLARKPKYLRAPISRGGQPTVERDGGYRNAGIIRGVSVITKGDALGHDMFIDDVTLEQVNDIINATRTGTKSRFTHPSMSGDGLGKQVGRIMDSEIDGKQVIADQHFIQSAHKTPQHGDLAEYLMMLAEEAPEDYGISIAFLPDLNAERAFFVRHGGVVYDEGTEDESWDFTSFTSPDPLNVNNYRHVRLAGLHAADAVDEPAANPGGLFHRTDVAKQADELAAYALGFSAVSPETNQFGLDPDRVRGFVSRFLSNHQLEIRSMSEQQTIEAAEAPDVTVETNADAPVETSVETPTESALNDRTEAHRFRDAFGDQGAVWFAEGLSFEDCRVRQLDELRKENESLQAKLAARPIDGEDSPVSFDAKDERKRSGFASNYKFK